MKEKEFTASTLRDLLGELEKIGFGKFVSRRSYSWEGFDLRSVGRLAIASSEYKLSFEGLHRAEHDFKEELEKKMLDEALVKPSGRTKGVTGLLARTKSALKNYSEDELIAALEAKGLEVFTRKKTTG